MSFNPDEVIKNLERGAAILRVFGPVAEQVGSYIYDGGPEPSVFTELPALKAPAALERARHAARHSDPSTTTNA